MEKVEPIISELENEERSQMFLNINPNQELVKIIDEEIKELENKIESNKSIIEKNLKENSKFLKENLKYRSHISQKRKAKDIYLGEKIEKKRIREKLAYKKKKENKKNKISEKNNDEISSELKKLWE